MIDLVAEIMPAAGVSPVGKTRLHEAINSHTLKAYTGDWQHIGELAESVLAGIAAKMKSEAA